MVKFQVESDELQVQSLSDKALITSNL